MTKRKPLIAGNWKMHKTGPEAVEAARTLVKLTADVDQVEVMIAPAFTALAQVAEALRGTRIILCAQNMHWESQGAFTGEISAEMLQSAGCTHVILGHSERRQFFGETDQTVNLKLRAALAAGLKPILCIGESESERDEGKTFSVLDKQVQNGLKGLLSDDLKELILAYEPVWAIGTGKTATSEQAQQVHAYLRDQLAKAYGRAVADSVRILYGGSVKPANIAQLMAMEDIDGALVGGASLEPGTFNQLVHYQN